MKFSMKHLATVLCAFLLLTGCGGSSDDGGGNGGGGSSKPSTITLSGEYMLSSYAGDGSIAGSVYLSFSASGTFVLYQHINTSEFSRYVGYYNAKKIDNRIYLTGSYADGAAWGESEYTGEITDTTLTLTGSDSGLVSIYTKTKIPDYVKTTTTASEPAIPVQPFL